MRRVAPTSPSRRAARLLALLALSVIFVACGAETDEPGDDQLADPTASEAPLSDVDALLDGAPPNAMLPEEGKADAVYPAEYYDLVALQSPVKSQGSRGVCSIFSTTALMEHLYIKEGTIAQPDFSEQFLQWSVKNEVGAFKNTGGSNARSNLQAISRHGVPEERAWPYESRGWGTSDNPECTGDSQPVDCYTNGAPPSSALEATRFTLPAGRYVNSRERSVKAFMIENETAVVAGMTFFYQSWNHRGSKLPVNSSYWSEGYILYPNAADKEKSLEKRAGHSILIVGWNDDLEVQKVDGEGNKVVDANGEPVMEKGFFLIKNSWGTGGFGKLNPHGDGYGWLSYEYVEEYASIYGSGVPELELVEICDDGLDNDFNGLADCADTACAGELVCKSTGINFENTDGVEIPDNDPAGISTTIQVDQPGTIATVDVTVDITHAYRGDLTVTLVAPDGARVELHKRDGGSADDLRETFRVDSLEGASLAGPWTLEVIDGANGDTGRINGWSLNVELGGDIPPEVCGDGIDNDGSGAIDCADSACAGDVTCSGASTVTGTNDSGVAIPDGGPAATSSIVITDEGTITALTVAVDIEHTYRPDLTVVLKHPNGTEAVLADQLQEPERNLVRSFSLDAFNELDVTGEWVLEVTDNASFDEGTLRSWSLEIDVLTN